MKYKFEGIGDLSATLLLTTIAASSLSFLARGIPGKVTHWILKQVSMYLADKGLMILNVGIAEIQTLSEKKDFDGSIESAIREVNEKRARLTDAEKKAIDEKVIDSFTRFARFGSVRDSGDPKR